MGHPPNAYFFREWVGFVKILYTLKEEFVLNGVISFTADEMGLVLLWEIFPLSPIIISVNQGVCIRNTD